jgi:hypothetical protein
MTRVEAEAFARQFFVVRKSVYVRLITYMYNKHALRRT